jgi:hypothetical protein
MRAATDLALHPIPNTREARVRNLLLPMPPPYFHQRMTYGVRTPSRSRIHPMAMLEDPQSIQAALMEVINAPVRNHIDYKRASLVIRALHTAVRNAKGANFRDRDDMVQEVPEYPAATPPLSQPDAALLQAGALTRINKPKPRFPSDYGITAEEAIADGCSEMIQPPRDLDEANAAVARMIQSWIGPVNPASLESAAGSGEKIAT